MKPVPTNRQRVEGSMAFIAGATVGTVMFIVLYGTRPLNIFDLDWTVTNYGGDFTLSSVAALAFVRDAWHFPPGVVDGLIAPFQTSIAYTDGVPLFAFPAKLIAHALHADIQYFGPWGCFCMAFQGGIAALILRCFTQSILTTTIASLFYILSPFMLEKMFGHVSMSGQWVVLLPILLICARRSAFVVRYRTALWAGFSALSMLVLPYFFPMVFGLLVLDILLRFAESSVRTVLIDAIVTTIASFIAAVASFWLAGGILPGYETAGGNYGFMPLNLNALVNPAWSSQILQPLNPGPMANGEGFAWIGTGVLIGAIIVAAHRLLYLRTLSVRERYVSACYVFVSACFLAFAATNRMMFGSHDVLDFALPAAVERAFSSFRTSARFVWPVWYLLVTYVLGSIIRFPAVGRSRTLALVSTLLFLQISDGMAMRVLVQPTDQSLPPPPLPSAFWREMGATRHHLVVAPNWGYMSHEVWSFLTFEAVRQHMTTNLFWLGRYPQRDLNSELDGVLRNVRSGVLPGETLVVVNYLPAVTGFTTSDRARSYLVDNEVVLTDTALPTADAGAKSIDVRAETLPGYLNAVFGRHPNSLLIVTCRGGGSQEQTAGVRRELSSLGVTSVGDIYGSYVAVLNDQHHALIERGGAKPANLSLKAGDLVDGNPFPLSVEVAVDSLSPEGFPTVKVDGTDVSRTLSGVNLTVVDALTHEIVEQGTFPLSDVNPGVVLTLSDH